MKSSYETEGVKSGRVVSSDEITSLPFKLPNDEWFSVFLLPKFETTKLGEVVNANLQQKPSTTKTVLEVGDWSSVLVKELLSTPDLLDNYRVFWGVGNYIEL